METHEFDPSWLFSILIAINGLALIALGIYICIKGELSEGDLVGIVVCFSIGIIFTIFAISCIIFKRWRKPN